MNESRLSTRHARWWLRGVLYVLGISLAIIGSSALVVIGMRTGRSGMSAIVLAAVVPLGGLAWAVVLSRLRPSPPPRPMPDPAPRAPDLVGPDQWYA